MSTSRTITSILLTILLAAAHLTTGSPISSQDTQARSPHNTHDRRGGTPDLSRLTLPTIAGAATPLPTPPAGYKLKHVALGVGTQNYTCSGNGSATPSSAGALASLWDIGPFLSSPLGRLFEDALPPLALAMYGALSSSPSSSAATDHTWWDAVIAQMPWESTATGSSSSSSSSSSGLPSSAFGEHFFSSTLTPTWDLFPSADGANIDDVVFQGTKEGSAAAPADACAGLEGEGAVPWLYLTKAATTDDGIAAVYRVVTAGGTARDDACAGLEEGGEGGEVEVKYAAEYWFYGP
ncbi:hypothetical protein SLS55_005124 [Diplodia seriata]|uniref:Malate dehydrogenase n=1 Tax=Diplodia seriata TaxID=420778 RepID=A0ABR3CFH0_9PEZI